jgi:hypothetical protein
MVAGGTGPDARLKGSPYASTVALVRAAAGGAYAGGLSGGADIAVSELGSDATAFHMVEVSVNGR